MKKDIEGYIKWLNVIRVGRRRALALVLAMSVAVSGNVFWLMRTSGTALSEEPLCGITEHKHGDECYETVLICEDEEHEHTDECYETRLICELPEHTHNEGCYVDISSHETKKDWEKTIPELTGDHSDDLISVAASQLGYEEGADGYSRFGDWYGNADADWNAMFVSFCLNYAGISKTDIPYGSGCWAWQVKLAESELLVTDMTVKPLEGDILLIDTDGDGKCDLTGVIMSIDGDTLSVAEGDVEGKVEIVKYDINSKDIFGYVPVNSLDAAIEEPADEEASEPVIEEPAEEQDIKTAYEFDAKTGSGIKVHVNAPDGAFPEGVVMSATDVDDKDVIAQAESTIDVGDDKEIKGSVAVDITFKNSEGKEVEPADGIAVDVNITIPEYKRQEATEYQLFHVNDSGVEEVRDAKLSQSEAAFKTDGFSIYVVTYLGERDKDKVHEYLPGFGLPNKDGYVPNREDRPYLITVGETLNLIGEYDDPDLTIIIDSGFGDPSCISIVPSSEGVYPEGGHYRIRRDIKGEHGGTAKLQLKNGGTVIDEFYIRVDNYIPETNDLDINDYGLYQYHEPSNPLQIKVGDVINIKGYTYLGEKFTFIDHNGDPVSEDTASRWMLQTGFTDNGDGSYTQTFLACGETDQPIGIILADRIVYFDIDTRGMLDHADIEIADDGIYTDSRLYGEGGVLKKKVTQYQSYVCDVNKCDLYKSTDESVPTNIYYGHLDDYGDGTEGLYPGNPTGFVAENYWQNEDIPPGSTQYELTSKYKRDEHGNYCDISRKQFFYSEVDHAIFDVQLELRPEHEITYKLVNGSWVPETDSEISYHYEYDSTNVVTSCTRTTSAGTESVNLEDIVTIVPSAVFNLPHKSVIDAYNKCPLNNGLDFTIQANSAMVEFAAYKELLGRRLVDDEFDFGLYSDEACMTTPIDTATNDASGEVIFQGIHFEEDGNYTYYVKEIAGSDDDIHYDPTRYKVVIKVENLIADIISFEKIGENEQSWSDAEKFEFNNSVKFKLPDTGGGGIVPYIAVGTSLIGSALILLMLRRRKEVDL